MVKVLEEEAMTTAIIGESQRDGLSSAYNLLHQH
jgi:hypothetical protein